jgi:hypothetical protein
MYQKVSKKVILPQVNRNFKLKNHKKVKFYKSHLVWKFQMQEVNL